MVITKYKLRPSQSLQTVLISSTVYSFLVGLLLLLLLLHCLHLLLLRVRPSGLFSSRINLLNVWILQIFCVTPWTRGTGPSLYLYLSKKIQREKDMDTLPFSEWDDIPRSQDSACPRLSGHTNWLLFHPNHVVTVCYFRHNPTLHRSHSPTIPTFVFVLFQSFVRQFTVFASLVQNTWTQALPILWYKLNSCSK